jgi:hypothetical protein
MLDSTYSQVVMELEAKRQQDVNEPKRPLTPFSLYMQTVRPIIATNLGFEAAAKNDVSTEGTRRWGAMAEGDRTVVFFNSQLVFIY